MELINNVIFNENVLIEQILHCAKCLYDTIDEENKEKKKINDKMYANAFALLLKNGMKCSKEELDGRTIYMLLVNNEIYEIEEEQLKNVLFKDFEKVTEEALRR